MKQLDLRFMKEHESKKQTHQLQMMEKLQQTLTKRIAEKFDDVQVRVRFSSSSGYDLSGFRGEEKEKFLAYLEELWNDSTLLEEY